MYWTERNLFNKYKNECIIKLTEAETKYKKEGNVEDSKRVLDVIEKINNKTFVSENITADLCGFAELSKIFE